MKSNKGWQLSHEWISTETLEDTKHTSHSTYIPVFLSELTSFLLGGKSSLFFNNHFLAFLYSLTTYVCITKQDYWGFVFFWTSSKWNHTVYRLLWLVCSFHISRLLCLAPSCSFSMLRSILFYVILYFPILRFMDIGVVSSMELLERKQQWTLSCVSFGTHVLEFLCDYT